MGKEEAWNTFGEWLTGEPDCLLPCWAHITPGKTSWHEAVNILSPIITASEITQDFTCLQGTCSRFDWQFSHLYTPQDFTPPVYGTVVGDETGQVLSLSIHTHTSEMPIMLDHILKQYGFPEKVLIETSNYDDPDEIFYLDMILTFPEYNFILRYNRVARIEENSIVGCGDPVVSSLFLLPEETTIGDTEQILTIVFGEQETYPTFQKMESVSNWTIETFYYYYIKYPTACLSSPLSSWP